MKNYLLICILILLSLLNISNALVSTEEQIEAEKILDIIGESGYSVCQVLTCDNAQEYVIGIDLHNVDSYSDLSPVDFGVFSQLQTLNLGSNTLFGTENILNSVQHLTNLKTFVQTNLIESSDVELPNTLTTLQMDNFKGVFYAKWVSPSIQTLSVGNTQDFSLSGSFSTNTNIYSLTFPVPSNGLPNLDEVFPNLTYLQIYMKDVTYTSGSIVPSSYMGSYHFNKLVTLIFTFDANTTSLSISKPFYLPDFSQLKALFVFTINGEFFVLNQNQNQIFDLSNNPANKLSLTIQKTKNLLKDCKNCVRVPENTQCSLNYVNVTVDNLSLLNCSTIKLTVIDPVQHVSFKSFNFDRLTNIDISSSNLYGDLVDDICKINYNYVSIKSNLFSTKVPSCYLCTSDLLIRSKIIPNKFTDFTSSTPASCPGFNVTYSDLYLVKTEGDSILIKGKDLGFAIQVSTSDYAYEILNYEIRINTPAYVNGNGATNKSVTITFPTTNSVITFNYHYAPPTITSYSYDSVGKTVKFFGSGFDFSKGSINNLVTINTDTELTLVASLATPSYLSYDNSQSNAVFFENQSFTIKVEVGNQESTVQSFVFTSQNIEISTDNIVLQNNGSTTTISGSFISTDLSNVQLLIGDIQCTVTQITLNSITFTFPGSDGSGDFDLYLIVNGKFTSTTVYVQNVEQESSTSSSNSNSSSSDSDNSKDSDSDSDSDDSNPNSAIKLNFNLIGLISFIIISLII